jgi:hypothetical protein
VVVDEGQDIRGWWWPALLSLHRRPDDGTLYVFADESQNLYGGEVLLAPDDFVPPLRKNLRNTQAISEFVSVFFDADPGMVAKGPPGRDVDVLEYEGEAELVRLLEVVLVNLTDQEGLGLDDIVVLTPAGESKSLLWQRGQVGRFRLSKDVEPDTVLWSTVHGFKGLERPVVVLAEIGERHEEDVELYIRIGASRATNHVVVLATPSTAAEMRRRANARRPRR